MDNFPKGKWEPPVFTPQTSTPESTDDGVTASSYVPSFKFLTETGSLNNQPSRSGFQPTDMSGRPLKYPANTFVRQPSPPQKRNANIVWIYLSLGTIVLFLCLLFASPYLPGADDKTIVKFCFYVLVPAFFIFISIFLLQLFIYERPVKPKPEPAMNRVQTSFFHFIAQGVLNKDASTFTGAMDIARQLPPSNREKYIEQLIEDKTAYIKVFAKITLQEGMIMGSHLDLRFGRHLNRMSALERGVLKALFMLYNQELINDHTFHYYLIAIVWGDGKAIVERFDSVGLEYVKGLENRVASMSEADIINWSFAQENLSHDQALSKGLALTDDLYASNPDNPTIRKVHKTMRSGGKWFKKEDIEKSIYTTDVSRPYSLYLGNLEDGTPLAFDSNESIITIAPPGSGKTQTFVIPNLLRWQGPAIVLDVKGELYEKTAGYRSTIGPVYQFNVFADNSDGFNPFDLLSEDMDDLWTQTLFLSKMMLVPSGIGNGDFWDKSAQSILRSIIAAMILDDDNDDHSLNYVFNAIANRTKLDQVQHILRSTEYGPARRAADLISDLREREEGTSNMLSNILHTLKTNFDEMEGDRVIKATSKTDWSPKQLRNESGTVYIKLKPGESKQYAPLIRLLLGIHMRELTPEIGVEDDADFKPFLFMLDEMPDLAYMEPIEKMLDMGRGAGLRMWMFAQDRNQIRMHYNNAGAFVGKCAVQIFMDPQRADGVAQEISNALGNKESLVDGRVEPVLTTAELAGPDYGDKSFIFGRSAHPAIVSREMAWQSEVFKERMSIPAPSKQPTKKSNPIPPRDIPDFIKKGKKL